jgi:DNA-binding NarL/FixJ family response regulator
MRLELSAMLEGGGFRVLPVASAEEALEALAATPNIQAVVTDRNLSPGGKDGFALARQVSEEHGIGVVILSRDPAHHPGRARPEPQLLIKPVAQTSLVDLVQDVVRRPGQPAGQAPPLEISGFESGAALELTPRQQEVLELLVQGKSNRDIAHALGLSANTVKVHLVTIYRVLGVSSRTEALLAGLQHVPNSPRSS